VACKGTRVTTDLEPELPVVGDIAAAIATLVASDAVAAAMVVFNTNLMVFRTVVGSLQIAVDDQGSSGSAQRNAVLNADTRVKEAARVLADQAEIVHQLMRRELTAE
jgi:hypothetical protein